MDLVSTLEQPATDEGRGDAEPSKRERNKAEKRRRILAASRRLFRDQGFEQTTTAEISAAAGIATGTLYLYVNSKEDLLVDVFLDDVNRAWSSALQAVDPTSTVTEQMVSIFCHVADHHLEEPVLSRPYFREMPFATGQVRRAVSEFQAGLYQRLGQLMAEAQARGELAPEADCVVVAGNLFGAWYLLMTHYLGQDRDEELRQRITRSVETALLGLTGPSR